MNDLDRVKVLSLLESAALPGNEVDSFLERVGDLSYWRCLNPDLTIGASSPATAFEAESLDSEQIAKQVEKIHREGYFNIQKTLEVSRVDRMRACVEKLLAEGWPAVFSYVYDEFWQVVRTPSLIRLISGFLGAGYKQNSIVWTYYVAGVRGASGWPPHSDNEDGDSVSHLTVWVPLAEATLENGCMYVIPRDCMPGTVPPDFRAFAAVNPYELRQLLQAARALPAKAGDMMGWNHQLIHWGSLSSGHTAPRISIGVEFIADGVEPRANETPLFDSVRLPSFDHRLLAISKSILDFGRLEPQVKRYKGLAERVRSTVRG